MQLPKLLVHHTYLRDYLSVLTVSSSLMPRVDRGMSRAQSLPFKLAKLVQSINVADSWRVSRWVYNRSIIQYPASTPGI